MNPDEVACVIQTHNAKGETCGVIVWVSDLNKQTQEKINGGKVS
jgi:hypothetical protein